MLSFKASGFPPGAANQEMQARVATLRQTLEPTIQQMIQRNLIVGTKAKIFGGVMGRGMHATKDIAKGTDVFIGFGTFTPSVMHDDSLAYSDNYGSIIAGGINFDVIFDGKAITDEMFASNTARAKALRDINSNVVNHGCGRQRNVAGYWMHETNSNLWYMVYSTTRKVKAGESITSNYNEGVTGADRFFNTYASLIAGGSAPANLVRCGCKTAADGLGCMNGFAFDRSNIEPQPPQAAAVALAVAHFAAIGVGGGVGAVAPAAVEE